AQGSLEEGRKAYDAFLDRFPYCYGYWKKYADLEKRNGESSSPERVIGVFERGIESIPSREIYGYTISIICEKNSTMKPKKERGMQRMKTLFGSFMSWRSDKLWDHYVKWETSLGHFESVLRLYDRILRNPTQGLTHQFEMFRDFVKEHRPKEILGAREFLDVKKEDKPESEPAPDGESTEEEDIAMKEKIIFSRKGVYKATESFVQERWKFEDNIKRPYFHMKPLERGQLKNWVEYLDYEIAQVADKAKQREKNEDEAVLFERCLIACALYEEFWFKYIDWLKSRKGEDLRDKIRD
ncbi:Putative LOC100123653, partial [Caligus rogercresseyi]